MANLAQTQPAKQMKISANQRCPPDIYYQRRQHCSANLVVMQRPWFAGFPFRLVELYDDVELNRVGLAKADTR